MTDYERIKIILDYLKISANRFSKEIGLRGPQVFYDIKAGRCGISKDLARRIQERYVNLSFSWLLTGEGEMFAAKRNSSVGYDIDGNAGEYPLRGVVDSRDFMEAHEFDPGSLRRPPVVKLSEKGSGVDFKPEWDKMQIPVSFLNTSDGEISIRQYGDSMAPVIPAGSILLIRKVEEWRDYIGFGNDFVIVLRDGRRITKRIAKSDREDEVIAMSYNPAFADERLSVEMISEIWKVVSVCSLNGW